MRISSIAGAAIALQLAVATPAWAQAPAAPLSGKAAIQALVGNTVEVNNGGQKNAMYFSADGTALSTADEADQKVGRWSVGAGGQFCVVDKGETPQQNDCADLTITGNTVTFKIGTSEMSGTLVKGNPNKL